MSINGGILKLRVIEKEMDEQQKNIKQSMDGKDICARQEEHGNKKEASLGFSIIGNY